MRNVLVWLVSSVVILVLLAGFFSSLSESQVSTHSFPPPTDRPKSFEGGIAITVKSYDPARHELTASADITIAATDAVTDINNLFISLGQRPGSEEQTWKRFKLHDPNVVHQEQADKSRNINVDAIQVADSLSLPVDVVRSPLLYPFDKYETDLAIEGCVNSPGDACLTTDNLYFKTISIDYSALTLEPGLTLDESVGDEGHLSYTIRRNEFLRLSSGLLFGVAVLFFGYIVFIYKDKDLLKGALGYFGALWALRGLLVPKSITVFPTLVDYVVLTIFIILFVAVFAKSVAGDSSKEVVKMKAPLCLFFLAVFVCSGEVSAQVDKAPNMPNVGIPQLTLGKKAPSEFRTLQGPKLTLQYEKGHYKLAEPVRFEDLAHEVTKGAGSGERQAILFQVGTVNDIPLFITVDAPKSPTLSDSAEFLNKVQPPTEKLLAALEKPEGSTIKMCTGERVCTKTCNVSNKKICCLWTCGS
jgi:hypothetical protein